MMFDHQTKLENGQVRCDICPRFCELSEGQRGLCFVRRNENGNVICTTYGRSSGLCIDPIEKKPLYHFFPGSAILSFGTAGCNLTCKFCQNWDMSKARMMDILQTEAGPEEIAGAARERNCQSVAFTYNDPVIFYEYAIDTAYACREMGVNSVAVTAGFINPGPAVEFFNSMDAVNVDLKGFTEDFYHKICGGSLLHVLESLRFITHETKALLEITTLLIPGENDSTEEIRGECEWIVENLGQNIPLHFSAFHPDYKMLYTPSTPVESLIHAKEIAENCGINHVYLGNLRIADGSNTYCSNCGSELIRRDVYTIRNWRLKNGKCPDCSHPCPGNFLPTAGKWGNKYEPINF